MRFFVWALPLLHATIASLLLLSAWPGVAGAGSDGLDGGPRRNKPRQKASLSGSARSSSPSPMLAGEADEAAQEEGGFMSQLLPQFKALGELVMPALEISSLQNDLSEFVEAITSATGETLSFLRSGDLVKALTSTSEDSYLPNKAGDAGAAPVQQQQRMQRQPNRQQQQQQMDDVQLEQLLQLNSILSQPQNHPAGQTSPMASGSQRGPGSKEARKQHQQQQQQQQQQQRQRKAPQHEAPDDEEEGDEPWKKWDSEDLQLM